MSIYDGTEEITNSEDIIDSRSIIARIEYIERFDCAGELSEEECGDPDCPTHHEEMNEELTKLRALADEGANSADDWTGGAALIRGSYFEDYARQYAGDLYGEKIEDATWPFDCIDWEKAASDLQVDYSSVTFDGEEYWIR